MWQQHACKDTCKMASVHPPPRKAIGSLTVSYRIRTLHTCTPALILPISSPMTTSVATDSSCASIWMCMYMYVHAGSVYNLHHHYYYHLRMNSTKVANTHTSNPGCTCAPRVVSCNFKICPLWFSLGQECGSGLAAQTSNTCYMDRRTVQAHKKLLPHPYTCTYNSTSASTEVSPCSFCLCACLAPS